MFLPKTNLKGFPPKPSSHLQIRVWGTICYFVISYKRPLLLGICCWANLGKRFTWSTYSSLPLQMCASEFLKLSHTLPPTSYLGFYLLFQLLPLGSQRRPFSSQALLPFSQTHLTMLHFTHPGEDAGRPAPLTALTSPHCPHSPQKFSFSQCIFILLLVLNFPNGHFIHTHTHTCVDVCAHTQ